MKPCDLYDNKFLVQKYNCMTITIIIITFSVSVIAWAIN